MRIIDLIERLGKENIEHLSLVDPEADVYTVSLLTEHMEGLRDDVLYFGDDTLVRQNKEGTALNIVLYGSAPQTPLVGFDDANVVVLSATSDPFACYNRLQALFIEDQTQIAITSRMLSALCSNKGLSYLIAEAAGALNRPIVVVDPSYRYVAYSLADLEGTDSEIGRVLANEVEQEYLAETVVSYIRDKAIDSELARITGPLVRYNEIIHAMTMTGAVMVRGVLIAHVMMVEDEGRPFTDLDERTFWRLLDFVGQEMQKGEVFGPTSGELGAIFLQNLLGDRNPSATVTKRRMKALSFHPLPTLVICCFHAPGQGLTQAQAERVAAQLRPMLHHSLYAHYHRNLVVMVSREDASELEAKSGKLMREVSALNGLTVGISNPFQDITKASAAYTQARSAISLAKTSSTFIDDGNLIRYADVSYLAAIDAASRHGDVLSYVHPALVRLMDHDLAHTGELMDTLFCFLECAGTTKKAASMLSLHKNTLLYRMGRIREILGMDLASGEDLFCLQVGFRALIYLGLFTPRVALRRADLTDESA